MLLTTNLPMLPPGDENDNYKMKIIIQITNKYGIYKENTIPLVVSFKHIYYHIL